MARINVNGTELYYDIHGTGKEVIVFSHGLLWSHKMFNDQVEALKEKYTVIVYDHRGQGQSASPQGSIDLELLTEDALQLIRALSDQSVHFVGLSMGGFVGIRLAARYPEQIKSLILIESSAQAEPKENLPKYKTLNTVVKLLGVWAVAKKVMPIMFSQSWLNDPDKKEDYKYWLNQLKSNEKSITKSVEAIIYRDGVEGELKNITCPTLILVGDEDVATTPEKAAYMHQNIEGAKLVVISKAGHSSSVEQPEAVNKALLDFLLSM